jgi:hypothetical protein
MDLAGLNDAGEPFEVHRGRLGRGVQFADQPGPLPAAHPPAQPVVLLANFSRLPYQLLAHLLEQLGPRRQLLDQLHRLAEHAVPAMPPERTTSVGVRPLRIRELGGEFAQDPLQGRQVVRHPSHDLLAGQIEAVDHVDRRVERQLAGADALEHVEDVPEDHGAAKARPAESSAGRLQLFRQRQFLLAGEKRDGAHLAQVKAQRVVRTARILSFGLRLFGMLSFCRLHVIVGVEILDQRGLARVLRRRAVEMLGLGRFGQLS